MSLEKRLGEVASLTYNAPGPQQIVKERSSLRDRKSRESSGGLCRSRRRERGLTAETTASSQVKSSSGDTHSRSENLDPIVYSPHP